MLAGELRAAFPARRRPRSRVLPNAVPVDLFGSAPPEERVADELLFVGYRKATKGIENLLRAVALARMSAGRRSRCGCSAARRTRRPKRAGRRSPASSASADVVRFEPSGRSGGDRDGDGPREPVRPPEPARDVRGGRGRGARVGAAGRRDGFRRRDGDPRAEPGRRRGRSCRSTIPKRSAEASSRRSNDARPSIRLALRAQRRAAVRRRATSRSGCWSSTARRSACRPAPTTPPSPSRPRPGLAAPGRTVVVALDRTRAALRLGPLPEGLRAQIDLVTPPSRRRSTSRAVRSVVEVAIDTDWRPPGPAGRPPRRGLAGRLERLATDPIGTVLRRLGRGTGSEVSLRPATDAIQRLVAGAGEPLELLPLDGHDHLAAAPLIAKGTARASSGGLRRLADAWHASNSDE